MESEKDNGGFLNCEGVIRDAREKSRRWPLLWPSVAVISTVISLIAVGYFGDFRSSLKNTAIVLTGVFAIAGLFFETKDKMSGVITPWGRTFLSLTIVSILCGLIGESLDSAQERKRNAIAQEQAIKLMTGISRSMQAIEQPNLQFGLRVDCSSQRYRLMCAEVLTKEAARFTNLKPNPDGNFSYSIGSDYPNHYKDTIPYLWLDAAFYRQSSNIDAAKLAACYDCRQVGDLQLSLSEDSSMATREHYVDLRYNHDKKVITVELSGKARVWVNNSSIMTVPDFEGASVLLDGRNNVFEGLTPEYLWILTPRGQMIDIGDFRKRDRFFASDRIHLQNN